MHFVYPSFLFALFALAIPIIIHLFYFRRFKTVYFTNVKLLQELKEESSSRSKLRNLLVLLMRCLAVAAMVFAFAQPFIPLTDHDANQGRRDVSVYVDNSFSMAANDQDVPLLEKAKQRAREVIAAFDNTDQFQILTADFEGRHQRLVSKDDALKLVDDISISPATQDLTKIMAQQRKALRNGSGQHKLAFVVSDFQKTATLNAPPAAAADTLINYTLVPLQAVQKKNVSIDSCWFESPVPMLNTTNKLVVRLRNFGEVDENNLRLTLTHNGQVKPVGNVSIAAKATRTDTIPITVMNTGWHRCEVSVTDYPVTFDDAYFLAFKVAQNLRVLSVDEGAGAAYLDAVFRGAPMFQVTHAAPGRLDYSRLKEYNLIIINGLRNVSSGLSAELLAYCKAGGNILVLPAANADANTYNAFLTAFGGGQLGQFSSTKRSVASINTDEFIFSDVYINVNNNLRLPETSGNYALGHGAREEVLLRYRDGSAFTTKYRTDGGNLYVCAAPLDPQYSNLTKSAEVFVPMVYKMALSRGSALKVAHTIGRDANIEVENKSANIDKNTYKIRFAAANNKKAAVAPTPENPNSTQKNSLKPINMQAEFIPEQRTIGARVALNIGTNIKEAGYYDLFLKPDSTQQVLAFNYDRRESVLTYFNDTETAALGTKQVNVLKANAATNFVELVGERSRGIVLWKWCIILALVFLLGESLLLRFWKKN